MWQRIPEWLTVNKDRFVLFFGIVLVGILCFEAGLLQGKTGEKTPLVLNIPVAGENTLVPPVLDTQKSEPHVSGVQLTAALTGKADCVFVGSKNSNKYHLPSCTAAKRIKPENRVCFASKEEADRRGYVPSCVK